MLDVQLLQFPKLWMSINEHNACIVKGRNNQDSIKRNDHHEVEKIIGISGIFLHCYIQNIDQVSLLSRQLQFVDPLTIHNFPNHNFPR